VSMHITFYSQITLSKHAAPRKADEARNETALGHD